MDFKVYENIKRFSTEFSPLAEKPFEELVNIGFLMDKTQTENILIDYIKTAKELTSRPVNAPAEDKKAIAALSIDKKVFFVAKYFFNLCTSICSQIGNIDPSVGFDVTAGLLLYKARGIISEDKIGRITLEATKSMFADATRRQSAIATLQRFNFHQRLN